MRRVRTAVIEMKQLQRDRRAKNVRSRDIRMNAALSDERGDGRREKALCVGIDYDIMARELPATRPSSEQRRRKPQVQFLSSNTRNTARTVSSVRADIVNQRHLVMTDTRCGVRYDERTDRMSAPQGAGTRTRPI